MRFKTQSRWGSFSTSLQNAGVDRGDIHHASSHAITFFYCCMIHPTLVHFRLAMSLTWDSQTQQWLPLSSKALLYMVQSSSPAAHANGESPSLGEELHYYIQFQKRLNVSSTFNSILTVVPLQQKLIGKLALSCPNYNRIREGKLRLK